LLTYLRNFRTGLHVKKRIQKLSQDKYFVLQEIPQGYSYAFAIQFSKLHPDLGLHESLLTYSRTRMKVTPTNQKKYKICFVGQIGNLRRTRILQLAEKQCGSGFFKVEKDSFGGNDRFSSMEYILALESSSASLIPSGAFNNYNHRYCEALIMGKLPIVALNNLTDPNDNYYWSKRYPFVLRDSYKWLLSRLSRLNETQIEQILEEAQLEEFAKIRAFSNLVNELRNEN
jgi:hypothetical protein